MKFPAQVKSATAITFTFIFCLANSAYAQQPARQVSLDLTKDLGDQHVCMVGNSSVQFVTENELVLLAGPDADCYRAVRVLELVVITKEGQVLARKSWPSTYPFVVLSGARIAISGNGNITVLDDTLKVIQAIPLPPAQRSPVVLQKEGSDTLLVRLLRGEVLAYSGAPLTQTSRHETQQDDQLVYLRKNGEALMLRKQELVTVSPAGGSMQLADLSWLYDCNKLCQAWISPTRWAVSENGKRAVFVSSGTRFPVTDESGMFPFYRVVVVDLATGKEIYRKEFDTRTSRRTAQLSPNGDLLLMSDGDKFRFQSIQ